MIEKLETLTVKPKFLLIAACALITFFAVPIVAFSSDAESNKAVFADIPVLEEVYKDTHARRDEYTYKGLYPGMSRKNIAQYASDKSDQDPNIYSNSLKSIEFTMNDNKTKVRADFNESFAKTYKRVLEAQNLKPDDAENFAKTIFISEAFDAESFDAEKIIADIQSNYGEPHVLKRDGNMTRIMYKHETETSNNVRQICIKEVTASGKDGAYKYASVLGKHVDHMSKDQLEEALSMCPSAVEAFKNRVKADIGPVLEFRVMHTNNTLNTNMTYEAGHIFRERNAYKYLMENPDGR